MAAISGPGTRPWKVGIFAYTSFWAGVAGVFLAYYTGFITPAMGGFTEMSAVVAMGITGGLGTLIGPVVSTAALLYLSDQLRVVGEGYSSLLFGLALLCVVVICPWPAALALTGWRSHQPVDRALDREVGLGRSPDERRTA
jgi:branched-chain amino acid transport system permease protein